ncbi:MULTISPECIES: PP2C family protein-serine/threonine phosphatase [unclassified Ruegeria]|uniref:PP2C family protein-serine/threonine phosphatase n=1 Tax=unclassified Ruegeria TaxID=2625375 RepID=UPI001488FD4F|nr:MULTISPECIES: SpoIIE family protein phosphatase [unclassified Ruegeria]NOE33768.1 SpoIIE family protein phosphatase [Ruegeria sp. HKCCD7318]
MVPRASLEDTRSDLDFGAIRKVLVVDDSRLQRLILVASLRKWGFDVVEADTGEAALELCQTDPPDLVLSDWVMPGMSGLEFCCAFRALNSDQYSYFILLTSKSEKQEVARGLDAGADDFLIKPLEADELRARISAGARILDMQRELSQKNRLIESALEELKLAHDAIDKDLMQARKIQESLVPELMRDFGNSRVSLLLKPCGHIGGDLVGMFSPGVNRLGFYSIDVSGHGITSAMMTARLGSYLSSKHFDQNVAMEQRFNKFYALLPPEDVAKTLNSRLMADTGIEEYFTMVYAIVDLRNGLMKMVQAGHPHPLLLRKDGGSEFLGDGGLPVGLIEDAGFQQIETKLQPGDKLLLYSDGFTECPLADGGLLDENGLQEMAQHCVTEHGGSEFLDDMFWRLTQVMSPNEGIGDDVSAVFFEYNGP